MPTFELEESAYAGAIEEDSIFRAEVMSVNQVKEKFTDKDTGADVWKVEFKFVIQAEDDPHDGDTIYGKTGTKFNTHPDCKLRNWSGAILSAELEPGFVLDTDALIGQVCRIVVGARHYEDPKTKQPKTYNFVSDVLPVGDIPMAGDDGF